MDSNKVSFTYIVTGMKVSYVAESHSGFNPFLNKYRWCLIQTISKHHPCSAVCLWLVPCLAWLHGSDCLISPLSSFLSASSLLLQLPAAAGTICGNLTCRRGWLWLLCSELVQYAGAACAQPKTRIGHRWCEIVIRQGPEGEDGNIKSPPKTLSKPEILDFCSANLLRFLCKSWSYKCPRVFFQRLFKFFKFICLSAECSHST